MHRASSFKYVHKAENIYSGKQRIEDRNKSENCQMLIQIVDQWLRHSLFISSFRVEIAKFYFDPDVIGD